MRRCVIVLALLIGVGVCLVACGREEGGLPPQRTSLVA